MQPKEKIIDCYDKAAEEYAKKFIDELSHKPFDRMVLKNFAQENKKENNDGNLTADLGCGPGQTTKYLYECGIKNIIGIDISPGMIKQAKSIHKKIKFETGNMLELKYSDKYFSSVIAFYAIVNFTYEQVKTAFKEINRVLKLNGQFLFSFHIGEENIHMETFLEKDVEINFYFFKTEKIIDMLEETGFKIITAAERFPHADVEYPSKRAYILCEKII
ncbi:MAG: class I SAM-dependent methyltransferase [Bacteroidota bacterium]|nr:class I SAM-dependent methyltransferase [Bacteroidota bacterium]